MFWTIIVVSNLINLGFRGKFLGSIGCSLKSQIILQNIKLKILKIGLNEHLFKKSTIREEISKIGRDTVQLSD